MGLTKVVCVGACTCVRACVCVRVRVRVSLCMYLCVLSAQAHTVTLDLTGPEVSPGGKRMTIQVVRNNPADPGKVTGLATYVSFYSSLKGKFNY